MNNVSIVIEKVNTPITYQRGDIFRTKENDFYIFAQVATRLYNLISLGSGNRFHDSGVSFKDLCAIIEEKGFIKLLPKTEIKLITQ